MRILLAWPRPPGDAVASCRADPLILITQTQADLLLARTAPEIVSLYSLNVPAYSIRAKIREEFERHREVTDLSAVDILLLKSYQDLQEVRETSTEGLLLVRSR